MPAADLFDAAIAQLRATPAVVAAFAEDRSSDTTTKFWGDVAPPGVQPPYLVFLESDRDTTFMTKVGSNPTAAIDEGKVRFTIIAEEKYQARSLGDLIATTLDIENVTLTFAGGTEMFFRATSAFFAPMKEILPHNPSGYARVVVFDFAVQRVV
jgi:hypothetical protein